MIKLSEEKLTELERMEAYFRAPTGNPAHDAYHQMALSMFSSPDSSGIQEQILAQAIESEHKGGKKLGADAMLDGQEVEIKPCKSTKPVSAVNITDDQPIRLIKDLQTPSKLLVIGRCPGGVKFRWVIVCRISDFAEHRYLAMCNHWKHEPEPWPVTIEEQIKVVERLAEKRTINSYLRSSQLKFKDIKEILAAWVHPEIDTDVSARRSEDVLMKKAVGIQTSVPQMAL